MVIFDYESLVQARFLLGPAGSGKTYRCLAEIRAALQASPEGDPLILLAPKQATFQLERQLLADPALAGYTRLHILSFDRLADFVLEQLQQPPPKLLNDEGRLMVLRALLTRKRDQLQLFRASARLPGFAQQLNRLLRELQRHHLTPVRLENLVIDMKGDHPFKKKLHDVSLLMRAYLEWLKEHGLQDTDCLLDLATAVLATDLIPAKSPSPALRIQHLWLDGFAEMTPQEIDLLAEVVRCCQGATLAFCLENQTTNKFPWLSTWSVVSETFCRCHTRLESLRGSELLFEVLGRQPDRGRFAGHAVLQHLERHWASPSAFDDSSTLLTGGDSRLAGALRLAVCANPEAEAILAAREIVRHVREGNGHFRDCAVLLRSLAGYDDLLRRVFTRYEIPFFLDRREPVAHHPLAELTRFALRTVAFGWKTEDWFGALKSGLVHDDEGDIDRLENEALAHGWKGEAWLQPLVVPNENPPAEDREKLRRKIVPPFEALAKKIGAPLSGAQLAAILRDFWQELEVEKQLERWAGSDPTSDLPLPTTVHATVWEQLQSWLENLERAFPSEPLSLREWLPILEAGLANLTVGVIPPLIDQVLIGTVDRSRNPDLQFVVLLGVNESVFPATPAPDSLLTESDREALERHGASLGLSQRQQIGQERYYGYIACTRARQRLVVTFAERNSNDKTLNPSPFAAHLQRLFPLLKLETATTDQDWPASEHVSELIAPLLKAQMSGVELPIVNSIPALDRLTEGLRHLRDTRKTESLAPALAEELYSPVLRTSVSRLEQFAACPFKFFVNSGLRAQERKLFEVDARERGSFQHEVLAAFHEAVRAQNKEWRDLTPPAAGELIGRIAAALAKDFRGGLFQTNDKSLFDARALIAALQKFMRAAVAWMARCEFNPREVELGFGEQGARLPAWEIDLGDGHRMTFRGKIDRVDLAVNRACDEALCVVIDYKSGAMKIDPLLLANGIQIQLPAYLAALRRLTEPHEVFGVARLIPAGIFYVNLRGRYERGQTRREVLAGADEARQQAYRHAGRFSLDALPQLDRGYHDHPSGQFNYKLTKDGKPNRQIKDLLEAAEFTAMLDAVEDQLRAMGQRIFLGVTEVKPYRKGSETACDQCDYRSICRIDPWTDEFRVLKLREVPEEAST